MTRGASRPLSSLAIAASTGLVLTIVAFVLAKSAPLICGPSTHTQWQVTLFLVVVGLTAISAVVSTVTGLFVRRDGRAVAIGLAVLLVCAVLFLRIALRGLDCIN